MYSRIFQNSLTEGDFNVGRFACQSLTEGDFFPTQAVFNLIYVASTATGHNYRDALERFADGLSSVAITQTDLTEDDYFYTYISVGATGLASEPAPSCLVQIDAGGDMISPVGNAPADIKVEQLVGGEARLTWRYNAAGEPAEPDGFKVYHKIGGGAYSLLSTLTYIKAARTYSIDTDDGDYSHAEVVTFDVRTYKGAAEIAGNTAAITIDAQGPAAITDLSVIY